MLRLRELVNEQNATKANQNCFTSSRISVGRWFRSSLLKQGLLALSVPAFVQILLTTGLIILTVATRHSIEQSYIQGTYDCAIMKLMLSRHAMLVHVEAMLWPWYNNASKTDELLRPYLENYKTNWVQGRRAVQVWNDFNDRYADKRNKEDSSWLLSHDYIQKLHSFDQVYGKETRLEQMALTNPEGASLSRARELLADAQRSFVAACEIQVPAGGQTAAFRLAERKSWARLLLLLSIVNLCAFIGILIVLVSRITRRLNEVLNNSRRFAEKKPLPEPMRGDDEISTLDKTLREMAKSFEEATKVQLSLLNDSSLLILSFTEAALITEVNEACLLFTGLGSKELRNKPLSQLMDSNEYCRFVERLSIVKAASSNQTTDFSIDISLNHASGVLVDSLWSLSWSAIDQAFFAVVHEISEQRQSERLYQEMVSIIDSGFRERLTTLQGLHSRLHSDEFVELNARGKTLLPIIDSSTKRMLDLIEDLHVYQTTEKGSLELSIAAIDVNLMLTNLLSSFQILASEKGVILELTNCDESIDGDEARLAQVIANLLSNAIKYTPRGRKIALFVNTVGHYLQINVKDEGEGIPAHALAGVFDRFRQVSAADSKVHGGFGVGLHVCKTLVELHGGTIEVESNVGVGSTFSIYLPKFAAHKKFARSTEEGET